MLRPSGFLALTSITIESIVNKDSRKNSDNPIKKTQIIIEKYIQLCN